MRRLRIAVIGLGAMGKNHVRVLHELENVEVVALCDAQAQWVEWAASKYGLRGYQSPVQLLESEQLDAVVVAVPTAGHLDVGLAALEHGLHVLVEKPIARNLADAHALKDAAEARGRILAVGHIERFNPAIRELKRRLSNGEAGRILQIHARRLGPFPPRIRDVGVIIDLATHDLDVMTYLLEAPVVRVYAETGRRINTENEDMLNAILRFGSGTIGVLDVNWLTPTKVRDLSVLGERGMFHANYLKQELSFYHNSAIKTEETDPLELTAVTEGNMISFHIERVEPLRLELESFVRTALTGSPPEVGADDGIRALELATQLVDSGQRGVVLAGCEGQPA